MFVGHGRACRSRGRSFGLDLKGNVVVAFNSAHHQRAGAVGAFGSARALETIRRRWRGGVICIRPISMDIVDASDARLDLHGASKVG